MLNAYKLEKLFLKRMIDGKTLGNKNEKRKKVRDYFQYQHFETQFCESTYFRVKIFLWQQTIFKLTIIKLLSIGRRIVKSFTKFWSPVNCILFRVASFPSQMSPRILDQQQTFTLKKSYFPIEICKSKLKKLQTDEPTLTNLYSSEVKNCIGVTVY